MAIHPFELTLGPGPYAFVGCDDRGGSCQHCNRAILYRCLVANANGLVLAVGTGCIEKINAPYMQTAAAQIAVAQAQKAARQAKAEKRDQSLVPVLATLLEKHGQALMRFRGPGWHDNRTFFSYAKDFLEDPSNIAGVIKRIKDLEKVGRL